MLEVVAAMIEEEAKRETCIGPKNCGQHRHGDYTIRYCIGSACKMAWRWVDPGYEVDYFKHVNAPAEDGWERYRDDNGNQRWRRKLPNVDGYCGLAGKP